MKTGRPLVNRAKLRRILLDRAKADRAHKFTRVAESALDEGEATLLAWAARKVASLPSKGATIR